MKLLLAGIVSLVFTCQSQACNLVQSFVVATTPAVQLQSFAVVQPTIATIQATAFVPTVQAVVVQQKVVQQRVVVQRQRVVQVQKVQAVKVQNVQVRQVIRSRSLLRVR